MTGAAVVYHTASCAVRPLAGLLPALMLACILGGGGDRCRVVYADNLYAYGPVEGR